MTPLIDYRDGSICSAYTAYFYAAGTSTAKNVWTEKEKTNAFTSKALGSSGAIQLYGDGVYKIIIKDADSTTVYEWDNVKVQHPNIAVLSKSGTYTATVDDDYIIVGATMTLNLFAAASATHPICVKLNGSYTLTIDPSGAELIDGSSTYSLTTSGAAVWLFAYGSAWYVANATSVTAVSAINLVASIGGSAELTATATTIDIMTNNQYLRQLDNAGTGYVNLIKANASDQIELGAAVAITEATFLNTGLHILDSNATHDLIIKPGSNLTADKTLTITTGDADRTISMGGNITATAAVSITGAFTVSDATTLKAADIFPATTKVLFCQNSAPTGWTRDAVWATDGAAVCYAASGDCVNAGAGRMDTAGTHAAVSHIIVVGEAPDHTHGVNGNPGGGGSGTYRAISGNSNTVTEGDTLGKQEASGGGHVHAGTIPYTGEVIACVKD